MHITYIIVLVYLLIQFVACFDPHQEFDWETFHRYFYEYVDEAIILDTDLIIRSVSHLYCSHIKPPVKDTEILGMNMADLIKGRVSNEQDYLNSINVSRAQQSVTRIETLDTEGNQYELETTPLLNTHGEMYGLRHSIKNIIRNKASDYLRILHLTSQTDSWKMLVDSIADYAIFAISVDFTIASWTDSCEKMYGYTETEVLFSPISLLSESAFLQGKDDQPLRREFKKKDQTTFIGEQHFSPIYSHNVLVGYSMIIKDMSSAKAQERLLLEAREEAQLLQTNFLSSISHESRSNTAIIISSIEALIHDTKLDQQQTELCEDIHQASRILLQVVEDILNYSSYMKHGVQLKYASFSIRKCVQTVVNVQKRSIDIKNTKKLSSRSVVEMTWSVNSDIPPFLIGDEIRLSQVITNLLSNAIKFTDSGFIRLDVNRCFTKQANSVCLVIAVQDTGVGISLDQQKKLYNPFYQADAGLKRTETGTGLGLANVKMITEAMGGKVRVESTVGVGSTFSCEVYMSTSAKPDTDGADNKRSYSLPSELLSTKVLVVEDNEVMGKIALRSFHHLGIPDVVWVDNGKEAIKVCKESTFDIIFMDLMLPILDGLEATRLIRTFNRVTPIIALTSNALDEHQRLCFDAGMNHHLSKPISIKDLRDIIVKFLPNPLVEDSAKRNS